MPSNKKLYAVWAYKYSPVRRQYDWVVSRYTYDPTDSVVLSPLGRTLDSVVKPASN